MSSKMARNPQFQASIRANVRSFNGGRNPSRKNRSEADNCQFSKFFSLGKQNSQKIKNNDLVDLTENSRENKVSNLEKNNPGFINKITNEFNKIFNENATFKSPTCRERPISFDNQTTKNFSVTNLKSLSNLGRSQMDAGSFSNMFLGNYRPKPEFPNIFTYKDKSSSKVVSVTPINSEQSQSNSKRDFGFKADFVFTNRPEPFRVSPGFQMVPFANKTDLPSRNSGPIGKKDEASTENEIKNVGTEEEFENDSRGSTLAEFESSTAEDTLEAGKASPRNSADFDSFETRTRNSILDFMDQVKVIQNVSKPRNEDPKMSFEDENFDVLFYKETEMFKNKERARLHFLREKTKKKKLCFLKPSTRKLIKTNFKKSKSTRFSTHFKAMHFFNTKKQKIECRFCGVKLSANGLGGHMSKKHAKQSIKFRRRLQTQKNRKIIKKKNEKLKNIRFLGKGGND